MNPPKAQRNRVPEVAQAGSIAGAIFAALVGADPFDIRNRSHAVQKVDYVAIALWVVAVVLFLLAAAVPAREESPRTRMLELALGTTAVAGAATAVTLLLTAFGFSVDRDTVLLRTTRMQSAAIDALCGKHPGNPVRLYGSIPTYTLDGSFLIFDFGGHKDADNSRCGTVRIPTAAVLAVQEHPGPP